MLSTGAGASPSEEFASGSPVGQVVFSGAVWVTGSSPPWMVDNSWIVLFSKTEKSTIEFSSIIFFMILEVVMVSL